jgi:hypothetical protein
MLLFEPFIFQLDISCLKGGKPANNSNVNTPTLQRSIL